MGHGGFLGAGERGRCTPGHHSAGGVGAVEFWVRNWTNDLMCFRGSLSISVVDLKHVFCVKNFILFLLLSCFHKFRLV